MGTRDRAWKKLITCCAVNRVDVRSDLIGGDYSTAVEIMDPGDALQGL